MTALTPQARLEWFVRRRLDASDRAMRLVDYQPTPSRDETADAWLAEAERLGVDVSGLQLGEQAAGTPPAQSSADVWLREARRLGVDVGGIGSGT